MPDIEISSEVLAIFGSFSRDWLAAGSRARLQEAVAQAHLP